MGDAAQKLSSGHGLSQHPVSAHAVSEHVVSIDLAPANDGKRRTRTKFRNSMRLGLTVMFVGLVGFGGGVLISVALLSGKLEIDKKQIAEMLRTGAAALKLIDSK